MGYIHVDKVTSCLIQPLRHCMRDQDPYVRKTAAVCVAKLFMQDRHLVENAGFIDLLRDMLVDSNPSVSFNTGGQLYILLRLLYLTYPEFFSYFCRWLPMP